MILSDVRLSVTVHMCTVGLIVCTLCSIDIPVSTGPTMYYNSVLFSYTKTIQGTVIREANSTIH